MEVQYYNEGSFQEVSLSDQTYTANQNFLKAYNELK